MKSTRIPNCNLSKSHLNLKEYRNLMDTAEKNKDKNKKVTDAIG